MYVCRVFVMNTITFVCVCVCVCVVEYKLCAELRHFILFFFGFVAFPPLVSTLCLS